MKRLLVLLLVLSPALAGCASMSSTQKGAVIGGGAGAVLGGVIGKATGNTAAGAVIGAAVGATAGAVIGKEMEAAAAELEADLEGAKVENEGEAVKLTFDSGILFGYDSSELRNDARSNLDVLVTTLGKYPGHEVMIAGHTDSRGSDQYNQQLSERRARAAADYLIARGIAPTRVKWVGLGETAPVASNDTDAGRAENRRVEIRITASEAYRKSLEEAAQQPPPQR